MPLLRTHKIVHSSFSICCFCYFNLFNARGVCMKYISLDENAECFFLSVSICLFFFFPFFFHSFSFIFFLCLAALFQLFKLTECDVLFDVVITVSLSFCHFAVIWNIRVAVSDAVYFVTSEQWRNFFSLSKCKCIRFVRRLLSNEQSHSGAPCTKTPSM